MPIYDYVCGACGHRLEVIHGVHEHGPRFCPECGAESSMKKAFVPPTIVFRGSGWAKKDRSAVSTKSRAASDDGDAGSKSGEAADAAPSGSKEASKPTTPAGKSASGESSTSAAD